MQENMPIGLGMEAQSFSGIRSARWSCSTLRTPVMRPDIIAISSFLQSLNIQSDLHVGW